MTSKAASPRRPRLWLSALFGLAAATGVAVTVAPSSAGRDGRPPAEAQKATTPTTAPPPATFGPGAAGADVVAYQARLQALGYEVRDAGGTFDDATLHATRAFQKVQGLPVTGEADAATLAALVAPRAPAAARPAAPLRVEVDLARQITLWVENGAVTRVYDSSTGAPESPTPAGEFNVLYKIEGWRHARLGPLWRPVYFTYDGIAFHGGEPVEPVAASHGCVRLTDASIDEAFPLLAKGTPVSVY